MESKCTSWCIVLVFASHPYYFCVVKRKNVLLKCFAPFKVGHMCKHRLCNAHCCIANHFVLLCLWLGMWYGSRARNKKSVIIIIIILFFLSKDFCNTLKKLQRAIVLCVRKTMTQAHTNLQNICVDLRQTKTDFSLSFLELTFGRHNLSSRR